MCSDLGCYNQLWFRVENRQEGARAEARRPSLAGAAEVVKVIRSSGFILKAKPPGTADRVNVIEGEKSR